VTLQSAYRGVVARRELGSLPTARRESEAASSAAATAVQAGTWGSSQNVFSRGLYAIFTGFSAVLVNKPHVPTADTWGSSHNVFVPGLYAFFHWILGCSPQ
jgi:hypothetical protein